MNALLRMPLLTLAAAGVLGSLVLHAGALLGQAPDGLGVVWWMTGGVFVVWAPLGWGLSRTTPQRRTLERLRELLLGEAGWASYTQLAVIAYAVLNFWWVMRQGSPALVNSPEAAAQMMRALSGHWLAFYSVAVITLQQWPRSERTR